MLFQGLLDREKNKAEAAQLAAKEKKAAVVANALEVVMKKPAAHAPHIAIKKPADHAAHSVGGLGCSKCRYLVGGCSSCIAKKLDVKPSLGMPMLKELFAKKAKKA